MSKREERAERWQGAAEAFLSRKMGNKSVSWELKAPASGSTSCIFMAKRDGEKKAVVRLFFKRSGAKRYAQKLKAMKRLGLPAAGLLARSRWWDPLIRRQPWMLAEEWLDGPMVCDAVFDERLAEDLGRSVGRMHAVTDSRYGWGKQRIKAKKFHLHCVKLLKIRLERAQENLGKVGREMAVDVVEAARQLERRLLAWQFEGPFPLVHGELGGDDMIYLPERREVAFLDLGAIRFNHRHFDFVFCRQYVAEATRGDKRLWDIFEAAYWREAGEQHRAQAEAEEPLIGGLLDIKRMQTRSGLAVTDVARRPQLMENIDELRVQLLNRLL